MSFKQRYRVGSGLMLAIAISLVGGIVPSAPSGASATSTKSEIANADNEVTPYLKEPTSFPKLEPLPKRPPAGESIDYVNGGGVTNDTTLAAIRAAAKTLGWTVTSFTYSPSNPATGAGAITSAIGTHPAGIIFEGIEPSTVKSQIATAKSMGIQLVSITAETNSVPGIGYIDTTSVNAKLVGRVASLTMISAAGKDNSAANVGVIATGYPVIYDSAQQVSPGLKKYCSTCTGSIIDVPEGAYFSGQSAQSVVSYIQVHPDVNVLFVILGQFEGGLVSALKAANLNRVKIVGYVPTPAQNEEVKDGAEYAQLQTAVQFDGWSAVDVIARKLTGMNTNVHNNLVDPVWVVTRKYINFDASQLPDFPIGYAASYEKLWHVK